MRDISAANAPSQASTFDRAAGGDEAAFARLVAEHQPAMARVAYVICGDADVARDATQNAWSIAWRRLRTVRQPDRLRSWLVAIAANEARQALRRRRRQPVVDISAALGTDAGGDPGETIAVVDLQQALVGLTPDERRLLALRFVAGLDSAEIGRHLGMSASGVRSRLARLVERLRSEMDHG
jgi:RNA polymerase sigma-70 factor (ECF subfamily)